MKAFAIFLGTAACLFGGTLKTGTYELKGTAKDNWSGSQYRGEVVISSQGENYNILWKIGSYQVQYGIGIFENDILSVSFADGRNQSFWGAVSYRLTDSGELEGKWACFGSSSYGLEFLTWKNENEAW